MTEIQGKSILVRVGARFELARVRVIGSQLFVSLTWKTRSYCNGAKSWRQDQCEEYQDWNQHSSYYLTASVEFRISQPYFLKRQSSFAFLPPFQVQPWHHDYDLVLSFDWWSSTSVGTFCLTHKSISWRDLELPSVNINFLWPQETGR